MPILLQVIPVHAGEHGDGEDHQFRTRLRCFHRRTQHLAAAGRMHGQHADPQLGCFGHGRPDGVGNIVILQIEKNPPSRSHQIAHYLRTFGGVELHADLIGQRGVSHRRHDLLCGGGGGNIQGDDEPLARIIAVFRAKIMAPVAHATVWDAGHRCRHPSSV